MFHLRRNIQKISFQSRYLNNSIIFSDVGTQINDNNIVNKLSFKLDKGDRIGLVGTNETGRDAVMQLLKGELKPNQGFINFLQDKSVVTLNSTLSRNESSLTAKDYLSKLSSSQEEIQKVLNDVELNDLRLVRTINTLSSSQVFRLSIASLLLKKPDVILVDNNFPEVSYDDSQFLTKFLKSNTLQSIIVINSQNEDFVQKIVNKVIEIESYDVPSTEYNENYVEAKSLSQQKKQQIRQTAAAALRAEIKRKAEEDALPETVEALNTIGFQNAREAVSQEEYIRVMLIAIALHPPALIALYFAGVFDAIL